ncbi:MAG: LanC-like protein [Candidatus Binataceae bacterium]
MSLYDAQRHEPLTGAEWNEERARAAIEQIVADTHEAFSPDGLWPLHPFDRSPERPPDSLKPLYHGAAGVIWALLHLEEAGAVKVRRDYLPTVRELRQRNRYDLRKYESVRKYMGDEQASYLVGETGILLLHWKLAASAELTDELDAAIESRIGDPRGLVWGGAGTMLAALFMHQGTGDSRWQGLFLRHFDALWNQWNYADELRCRLWNSDLYGIIDKRIGALHGFFAVSFPFLRGHGLLPAERRDEALRRIHETLHATALREGSYANWPNSVGLTNGRAPIPLLVQHCLGAPGIISCITNFPDDRRWEINTILQQAGEITWRAGPPVKFPSLCHGAAGSGYAFLKLYVRTGERLWLERARKFAMHAIEQCERAVEQYGQRKFSLWTGDLGMAIFLWNCIKGTAIFPTLDVF